MSKLILSLMLLCILGYGSARRVEAYANPNNAGDDIVIDGHDLHRTVNCNGNNVVIDANDSVINLRGECNEVQINGSTNTVTIDVVASITISSADNIVRWKKAAKGSRPTIDDQSSGNKIEQVK